MERKQTDEKEKIDAAKIQHETKLTAADERRAKRAKKTQERVSTHNKMVLERKNADEQEKIDAAKNNLERALAAAD